MDSWPDISELNYIDSLVTGPSGRNAFHDICSGEIIAYLLLASPVLVSEIGPPQTRNHYTSSNGLYRSKITGSIGGNRESEVEDVWGKEQRAIDAYNDSVGSPKLPKEVSAAQFDLGQFDVYRRLGDSIKMSVAGALAKPKLDGTVASSQVTGLFRVSVYGAGPIHLASILDPTRYPAGLDVEEYVSVIDRTGRGWRVHAPCLFGQEIEGCSYLLDMNNRTEGVVFDEKQGEQDPYKDRVKRTHNYVSKLNKKLICEGVRAARSRAPIIENKLKDEPDLNNLSSEYIRKSLI